EKIQRAVKEQSSWICKQCGEAIEDQFDMCWKCAGHDAARERGVPSVLWKTDGEPVPMPCPRCFAKMQYSGRKKFLEGALGQWLGELFQNYEHLDVYVCPRCGRVEFFASGIGDEFRSRGEDSEP